jgi:ParB/RepB/Spo0J family partition protein
VTTTKARKKPRYEPLLKLPPLSNEEYDGLCQSIAVNGVLVPILVDGNGPRRRIIDGNHRKQAADDLGYDCPEVVHKGEEEELRALARALNLARRQLSQVQKREIIADQLQETPDRTNRVIAKMLGVSHPTVASVRADLEAVGKIYQQDQRVGSDGKTYKPIKGSPASTERYTPPELMTAVRRALGRIDLDPASSREANKTVEATSFFNKRMDGLKQRWHGRVFLNPPFNDWPNWMSKLDQEIKSGRVKQAVVVGPANISAFRPLLLRGGLLLVPTERPKFHDPTTDRLVDPPFGSLICYVGPERKRFVEVFGGQGLILRQV